MDMDNEKQYFSIEEVAKRFGLNPSTVYHLAQIGTLPGFKVGSQWRFCKDMLDSWVADRVTTEWLRSEEKNSPAVRKAGKGG